MEFCELFHTTFIQRPTVTSIICCEFFASVQYLTSTTTSFLQAFTALTVEEAEEPHEQGNKVAGEKIDLLKQTYYFIELEFVSEICPRLYAYRRPKIRNGKGIRALDRGGIQQSSEATVDFDDPLSAVPEVKAPEPNPSTLGGLRSLGSEATRQQAAAPDLSNPAAAQPIDQVSVYKEQAHHNIACSQHTLLAHRIVFAFPRTRVRMSGSLLRLLNDKSFNFPKAVH
jgi:hypothetical protein